MTTATATAPVSGEQVTLEPTSQPSTENASITQSEGSTGSESSYYDSEDSLRKKINELTRVADTGSQEDVLAAMNELNEIEQVLERSKNQKPDTKPIEATVSSQTSVIEKTPVISDEPKKFSVFWQGQKVEREDKNNLLGYSNTGELKAALIKAQLQLQEHDSKASSLTERLREAEQKLSSYSQRPPQQQQFVSKEQPTTFIGSVTKPIAPKRPSLSTDDPTLYTEEDIRKVNLFSEATDEFNRKMIDYVSWIESRPLHHGDTVKSELDEIKSKLSEFDSERQQLQAERKRLLEEKADSEHWNQFKSFQERHKTFQTAIPVKELNEVMNKWMDSIAAANGVKPSPDGQDAANYYNQRAQIVTRYLNNDSQVVENAQGLKPPEDHEKFFRLLELYHALNKYREATVLGKNATLHDAYMRMKDDAGEIDEDLNTIRLNERTKAAEQFANGVQELQGHAINVDPKQSSGGPDINELGITHEDLKWFSTISPDKILTLKHKNRELFDKWNSIAAKIEKFAR